MKNVLFIKSGEGKNFDYSQDHVYVKLPSAESNGELCMVEDMLKPGFHLARHHHKQMTEVFYIIEGELEFILDDITISVDKGDSITIPPMVWHEVISTNGCKMLTIFKNGRFDTYLEKLSTMTTEDFNNAQLMKALAQEYDIWEE